MAGLNMSPGYNSPRDYQTLSEENLNNYGGMANRQAGLGQNLQNIGTSMYGKWSPKADQMYGSMAGLASRAPAWYADRAAITSNQAFDESKGVQDRTLSRMGINPNSGRFVGLQTQWGLARAAAEAGARTRASQDAEQTAFGRQAQLLGIANQGAGQGISALGAAGQQYGAAGEDYNRIAERYDRTAGEAAGAEGARDALRTQEANAAQARINAMLKDVQNAYNPAQNYAPGSLNTRYEQQNGTTLF